MDEARLIELIKSWETGYIAPSAQIVFRDARLLIETKNAQLAQLREELDILMKEIDALRNDLNVELETKNVVRDDSRRDIRRDGDDRDESRAAKPAGKLRDTTRNARNASRLRAESPGTDDVRHEDSGAEREQHENRES